MMGIFDDKRRQWLKHRRMYGPFMFFVIDRNAHHLIVHRFKYDGKIADTKCQAMQS